MYVIKRDGRREAVKFDKITARVKKLCYGLDPIVDATQVTLKVIDGIYDGVTTTTLDSLTAEVAATMTVKHPDYAQLASRIAVSNLHKNTKKSFSETMKDLYTYLDPKTDEWQEYWQLYCLQRLAVGDRQKLFESDFASLLIDAPST